MTTAIEEKITFEARMMARIKDSIGELMTDEELKTILAKGVEKALFHPRQVEDNSSGYGYSPRTVQKPALVEEAVEKFLKQRVYEQVDAWLLANPEKVEKAVKDAIAFGVGDAVIQTLDRKFQSIFEAGISQMKSQGLIPRN